MKAFGDREGGSVWFIYEKFVDAGYTLPFFPPHIEYRQDRQNTLENNSKKIKIRIIHIFIKLYFQNYIIAI